MAAQQQGDDYLKVSGQVDARTTSYMAATSSSEDNSKSTQWITGVNRFEQKESEKTLNKVGSKSSLKESKPQAASEEDDSKKKDVDIVEFAWDGETCGKQINAAAFKDQRMAKSTGNSAFNAYSKLGMDVTTKMTEDAEGTPFGLTDTQAEAIRNIDGKNELTPPKEKSACMLLMENMVGGFSTLLWIAAIMCLIAFAIQESNDDDASSDNLALGLVLIFVVVATGLFSFLQEKKSSDVMKSFAGMIPKECTVVRGGKVIGGTRPEMLVEGDIIKLDTGAQVPADMRILSCTGFKVDNASLTGESEAQNRLSVPDLAEGTKLAPLEAKNIAFFTTEVKEGSATGIVIRTGDRTVIGQIKKLVTKGKEEAEPTPIAKEIHHFIFLISAVAVFLGVSFFIISLAIGYDFLEAVVFLIGIIVANVPEGLLATVTVCLTLTAQRMKAKNVLVKQLESVETLGSTSCICSDKTGTLTQNVMTVAHVFYGFKVCKTLDTMEKHIGDDKLEEIPTYEPENPAFKELWATGQMCNVGTYLKFEKAEDNVEAQKLPFQERKGKGNATDIGILKFCDRVAQENEGNSSYGYSAADCVANQKSPSYRTSNPKVMNLDFSSEWKYAASVHQTHDKRNGDKWAFCLKGAPERVWAKCKFAVDHDGSIVEMTDKRRKQIEYGNKRLGAQGERVIGFSMTYLDLAAYPKDTVWDESTPYNQLVPDKSDLVFVGLMALIDPPREAVPRAIRDCQSGGIKVIMVTGDHPGTAKAIAQNIKIIKDENPTGDELAEQAGIVGDDKEFETFEDLPKLEQWKWHDKANAIVVTGAGLIDLSYTVPVTKMVKGKQVTEDELRYYIDAKGDRFIDKVLAHNDVVFARTSPAQKLEIVKAVQGEPNPHIVAVTGDGVNDSPALSAADIGVAMGIAGSDVSKGAADMILLNDDFASIVDGVKEGRIVFDNLKKSIAYTLTSNIPEISPFLIFVILSVPLPLSTVMILAIDLGTDMYPAISMAFEGPESDIMKRRPRNPKTDNLVTLKLLSYTYLQIGIIQACAGFFCYFVVMSDCGFKPYFLLGLREDWDEENLETLSDSYGNEWSYESRKVIEEAAQTSYFTSIVIVQWADLIICKTRVLSLFEQGMHNMPMNKAILFETCLAIFISYCPGIYKGLKTRPLDFTWWLPALSFSLLILTYDEIRKYLMRRARTQVAATGLDPLKHPGFVERNTYY
jgi:sodium/potassium-transporting ATPase subunit alpha